jgi:hypothetical protein
MYFGQHHFNRWETTTIEYDKIGKSTLIEECAGNKGFTKII